MSMFSIQRTSSRRPDRGGPDSRSRLNFVVGRLTVPNIESRCNQLKLGHPLGKPAERARIRLSFERGRTLLLTEIFPMLALELENLLKKRGEVELAAQVPQLKVVDRCRCGDNFCSSFYTQPKPEGSYGPGHRCLDLDAAEGMLVLDVVAGTIAHVEVLNRYEIRQKLIAEFP